MFARLHRANITHKALSLGAAPPNPCEQAQLRKSQSCRMEEFCIMRLVSFQISTPMGPQTRTGALDAQGRVVDLAAAYRLKLLSDGLVERTAARISAALLPGDMVELIEGGERALEAAHTALEWAAPCGAE